MGISDNKSGIDIWEFLEVEKSETAMDLANNQEAIKPFFETLDQLLKTATIKDHGDKVECVWIHMPTTLPEIAHGAQITGNGLFARLEERVGL